MRDGPRRARDPPLPPPGRRLVGQLVELTARELGLGETQIARVRRAALICDVGRDLDGSGYPRGLHHDEIPLEARIVAVAEAYVAMTSQRAHIPARHHEDAILELLSHAGTQFDTTVVQAFLRATVTPATQLASTGR
jgi:HD-GYP domain-containing protein (c-di-GMP phosphodiesterase class II)